MSGYASPPIPPLPPDIRGQLARDRYAAGTPMVAPRPQRIDPTIGHSLDNQLGTPPRLMPTPSLAGQISAPATADDGGWSPWNLSRTTPFPPTPAPMTIAAHPHPQPSPSSSNALTAQLPDTKALFEALYSIQQPQFDASLKITWARDVLFLADRAHHLHLTLTTQGTAPSLTDPIIGRMPLEYLDPQLVTMLEAAVPMVLSIASPFPAGQAHSSSTSSQMEPWQAESIYMRALFSSTGAFPAHVPYNPKAAFRDFESAARGGYAGAWFRLGRDYESFSDLKHAHECFERGARLGVESCLYRIGMAHLLGQLDLPTSPSMALPILHRAAVLSSLECPQPAYVYALLLLSEFSSISFPPSTFSTLKALTTYPASKLDLSSGSPLIPYGSSPHLESRIHLERSAYLHYPPAQYKLGHAYEFADPPFYFNPLLSVQYYSLASQAGEVEADMALSKWFLCGSTGGAPIATSSDDAGNFDKDESLALTFAQKASARNLASGHFAMGYYAEVGIGQPPSVPTALHYYKLAAALENEDAVERLEALQKSQNQNQAQQALVDKALHQQRLERSRTQAWRRAEEEPVSPPYEGRTFPVMKDAAQGQQPQYQPLQVPHTAALAPPSYPQANKYNAPHSAGVGGFAGRPGQNNTGYSPPSSLGQGQGQALQPQDQRRQSQPEQQRGQRRPPRDPRQVVDLVRKNSVASTYLPLSSAAQSLANTAPPPPSASASFPSAGVGGGHGSGYGNNAGVGSGRMPAGLHAPSPSAARPPGGNVGGSRPQSSNSTRPQSAGGRHQSPARQSVYQPGQNQGRQSPGPGRQGKLSIGVDGGAPPVPNLPGGAGGVPTTATGPASTAPAKQTPGGGRPGAATFAEMGIHGVKAEDKDCVIM